MKLKTRIKAGHVSEDKDNIGDACDNCPKTLNVPDDGV